MSCNICCENYNKSKRRITKCPLCDFEVCLECQETFILMSDDLKCMSCEKPLSRNFLNDQLPKTFITKKYNKHRQDVLFEQEKSLMPDTQKDALKYKKLKEYNKLLEDKDEELLDYSDKKYSKNAEIRKLREEQIKINIKNYYNCSLNGCDGKIINDKPCNKCNNYVCIRCDKVYKRKHTCKRKNEIKRTIECKMCKKELFLTDNDYVYCMDCNLYTDIKNYQNPYFYYLIENEQIKDMNYKNELIYINEDNNNLIKQIFNDNVIINFYQTIMNNLKYDKITYDTFYSVLKKNNVHYRYYNEEVKYMDQLFISISIQLFRKYINNEINKEKFINEYKNFITFLYSHIIEFTFIDKKHKNLYYNFINSTTIKKIEKLF